MMLELPHSVCGTEPSPFQTGREACRNMSGDSLNSSEWWNVRKWWCHTQDQHAGGERAKEEEERESVCCRGRSSVRFIRRKLKG